MKNNKIKILTGILLIGCCFMSTGCASWERKKKNWSSELGNGLDRIVRVYSATGELIETYEGKFDIDYDSNRVLFDDENGNRHCVYFENGTVLVDEK